MKNKVLLVRLQVIPSRQPTDGVELVAGIHPEDVGVLQLELKCYWLQLEYSSAREVLLKLNKLAPQRGKCLLAFRSGEETRSAEQVTGRVKGG